jgi:hypothetical protein
MELGIRNVDSVTIDLNSTISALEAFWNPQTLNLQCRRLAESLTGVAIILFDISAIAPLVASILNVPSVAISNFCWTDIYKEFVLECPMFAHFIDEHRLAYSKSTALLRYPFSCELDGFGGVPTHDVNFVVRRPQASDNDVRARLGVGSSENLMLLSFGGHKDAFGVEDVASWHVPFGWSVVVTSSEFAPLFDGEGHIRHSGDGQIVLCCPAVQTRLGISYVDLVQSSQVIVSKVSVQPAATSNSAAGLRSPLRLYLNRIHEASTHRRAIAVG